MRPGLALPALALACALIAAAPASAAKVGPKGESFYDPPNKLGGKKHGDLIWSRNVSSKKLKNASTYSLVLYRSESVNGDPIAVSGFVMLPKGNAPKGGWPVMTFAHGTTGIADKCAPSKFKLSNAEYIGKLWNGYLKQGYAVAHTDYEGLGTPGDHPYLIGRSEGRGVLDIVRAARGLDKRVGKRVLIGGHSQGGHAALWAATQADGWTPELKVLGVQGFAPIAVASLIAQAAESLTTPGGLSAYAGLTTRAFEAVLPNFDRADFWTTEALALYPHTGERCVGDLYKADSFGSISVADIVRDDADHDALVQLYKDNVDVAEYKLPGHVLIMHGTGDDTVPVALSDKLAEDLEAAGTNAEYKKYEGETHSGVVEAATNDALAHSKKRLK